ncbi:unnamed protein product [Protopolystoma xenopodis]|uniref:Uncharacterized protein n=1 Tax=Protopolystoma xenopodis TaxID=117903 RepID=A0A3S5CS08_9PLAT|nr:unnamed protein product [Protopolystoma xenopodis]
MENFSDLSSSFPLHEKAYLLKNRARVVPSEGGQHEDKKCMCIAFFTLAQFTPVRLNSGYKWLQTVRTCARPDDV